MPLEATASQSSPLGPGAGAGAKAGRRASSVLAPALDMNDLTLKKNSPMEDLTLKRYLFEYFRIYDADLADCVHRDGRRRFCMVGRYYYVDPCRRSLEWLEFKIYLEVMPKVKRDQIQRLWMEMDDDGSESIDFDEFCQLLDYVRDELDFDIHTLVKHFERCSDLLTGMLCCPPWRPPQLPSSMCAAHIQPSAHPSITSTAGGVSAFTNLDEQLQLPPS
eukprot:gene5593-5562_t